MNDQNVEITPREPVDMAILSFMEKGSVSSDEDLIAMKSLTPEDLHERTTRLIVNVHEECDPQGVENRVKILNLAARSKRMLLWSQVVVIPPVKRSETVDISSITQNY